jgi:hypothetical protein
MPSRKASAWLESSPALVTSERERRGLSRRERAEELTVTRQALDVWQRASVAELANASPYRPVLNATTALGYGACCDVVSG